jgi:peptidoglycan/xylan/chitin deacetylase (PgdA/CDA1 family)
MTQSGHLIGTHGHSHRMLTKLSYEEQLQDVKRSRNMLLSRIKEQVNWFRPAFGLYNEDTMKVVQKLGLKLVLWQVASWDWMHEFDEERIVDNVLSNISPGDIILLHELPQTVNILPRLIQGIRAKGFKLTAPHTAIELECKDTLEIEGHL